MNRRLLLSSRNKLFSKRNKSSVSKVQQSPAEHCLNLVRQSDYENYLCTLLLPKEIRSAGVAIRAFNVSVAQVEDQVHDKKIGSMRMKFWTDSLNETFKGNPPRSPVMMELHRIQRKHKLSKRYFQRLIDSRLEHLSGGTFLTLESLEKYSELTTSSIYYLLLESANIADVKMDHLASHLGKAQGIATLVRSIPYNAKKRINILPQDIMVKHSLSTESVFRANSSAQLKDVVCEVAGYGKLHLDKANSLRSKMSGKESTIFLPAVCVESYLEQLQRMDFDVFHPRLQKRNSMLPLKLLWRKWRH